jgi:hypothetical protein
MEEQIQIYKTMYALLTEQLYAELNQTISKAKGYPDDSDTVRYAPIIPEKAKANIQFADGVETFDTVCVMPITAEVQEFYPEAIEGIKLAESYTTLQSTE